MNSTEKLKAKPIKEQKNEKKFMFQFVNHETGQRSEPFVGSWNAVNEILKARQEGERPSDEDFILLVAVLDGKETTIPATPLITVKTYQEYNGEPKNAIDNETDAPEPSQNGKETKQSA